MAESDIADVMPAYSAFRLPVAFGDLPQTLLSQTMYCEGGDT